MIFDTLVLSTFFFLMGIFSILSKDSLWSNRLYAFWFLSVGLLSLPLLWLIQRVGFDYSFAFLHVVGSFITLSSNVAIFQSLPHTSLFLWQKSTLLACILPLIIFFNQTLSKPGHLRFAALNAVLFVVIAGLVFVVSSQLVVIFFSFELLLLSSLYLLRLTAKSERIGEAVTEMFFWTLAGSIFLFVGFILYLSEGIMSLDQVRSSLKSTNLASLMFLLGFGVKLPIWPCFSWLLKAHVEASVEFSILLSGVIVKFGALGVYKFINQAGFLINNQLLMACSLLGVMEASFRLLGQRDIKRIVALTTVIELNWIGFCVAKGGLLFDQIGAYLLVAHSFTTSSEFFLVECLYKRYHTRDYVFISGVANAMPALWLMSLLAVLVTVGFPGTSLFTAKLLFLANLASISVLIFIVFMLFFLLFIPVFFIRLWVPIWFGTQGSRAKFDISTREALLLSLSIVLSFIIGLCPALVID